MSKGTFTILGVSIGVESGSVEGVESVSAKGVAGVVTTSDVVSSISIFDGVDSVRLSV